LDRPGLGWSLAGLAGWSAVAVALWARGGAPAPKPGWTEPLIWALVATGLLAVGALRSAGWLFGLCVPAAAGATVLAVTGGRTVRGIALGSLLVPAAGWRGFAWARRGVSRAGPAGGRSMTRLAVTAALTLAVLLVFGGLLASADAVFSRLLGYAVPDLRLGSWFRWLVLFATGTGLALAATFLLLAPPRLDHRAAAPAGRVSRLELATPVGALVVLFAGFVGVQLTVLFGGVEYVLGPDGPTYAQYARGGFWQLLAVTALTLVVIGVAARLAPRATRADRWWLRGLLGALCLLTLVIVASALFRMHTYQEALGFTRLRVLVSVVELWLGLVFLLVLAAGVRFRAGWLPRAVLGTGMVALLALAALDPDRFIADRNIDRWEKGQENGQENGQELDAGYLAGLSADAVPALLRLPEPDRGCVLAGIAADLAEAPDDWREANLARSTARDLLTGVTTQRRGQCARLRSEP
jgi:hypothetical protein